MADVHSFRAIRYGGQPGGDLSKVLAPPYDVLSESDKQRMLAGEPHNIVAVDLPHTPPKSAGPPAVYQQAGDLLRTWLADAVLVRESAPAIYPYQQKFRYAGEKFVRRGFIARVRAEQFRANPAGIFPHEQTFSGPKEDRLMLTRAARCQLSPIFGLFPDEGNRITDALYAGLSAKAPLAGRLPSELGDVRHDVWRIDDPNKIAALAAAMADQPIFIADGHHRYTTALNYLAELEKRGPLGSLPADHPARFVMFVCVSMHDPGLAILPTHRVVTVRRFDPADLAARLAGPFEVRQLQASPEQLEAEVLNRGPGWFGVTWADNSGAGDGRAAPAHHFSLPLGSLKGLGRGEGGDACDSLLLRLTDPALLDRFEPTRGQAWRRLDVAVLHRYLIDEVLTPLAGEPVGIEYPHSGRDVAAALARGGLDASTAFGTKTSGATGGPGATGGLPASVSAGDAGSTPTFGRAANQDKGGAEDGPAHGLTKVALILAPTPLSAVRDVCLSGELMPQKSTFFYPKLATGLTLYDLAE